MEDLVYYINKPENSVAIFDGTNTTVSRRKKFSTILEQKVLHRYQLIWIESICDDEDIISGNIKTIKIHGLDYINMS